MEPFPIDEDTIPQCPSTVAATTNHSTNHEAGPSSQPAPLPHKKYHLHLDIETGYEPAFKRSGRVGIQPTMARKEQMRSIGLKHIDLWCDGSLYPIDPHKCSHPPFSNPTTLLKFAGNGHGGLLGYCIALRGEAAEYSRLLKLQLAECASLKTQAQITHATTLQHLTEIDILRKQVNGFRQKETSLGSRVRRRKLRNVADLKPGSGGLKKRIHALKIVIQPDKENINPNSNPAIQLKPLVSAKMAGDLLKEKKFKAVQRKIVGQFVSQNGVPSTDIQESMDALGVSRRGYAMIQKTLSRVLGREKIGHSLLPTPASVWKRRHELNISQEEFIGTPYHIVEEYSGGRAPLKYDEFNNIFLDLELLQRRMVEFYDTSFEECAGKLHFVLKMDECEILKQTKFERVTITLMNRALQNIDKSDSRYFSVQSETNVWWLGSFKVLKEDHDCLFWVFHHTPIPTLIDSQMNHGRLLSVHNIGDFQVEWHLAGDLKTLKCLYNCSMGGTAKSPCLYCMSSAKELDARWWKRAPDRHLHDPNFQPVFNIPLVNVHICTLHALCRIIEKVVYLYIGFAWKIKNKKERSAALSSIECVLSDMNLHGGNVTIDTDSKLSTKEKDIPNKVSINGVKARRFLSMPTATYQPRLTKLGKQYRTTHNSKIEWQLWKKLHAAVKDHEPSSRNAKVLVWKSLDILFLMCEQSKWKAEDKHAFNNNLHSFRKSYLEAWSDINLTHYMHIIHNHLPYFINQYGNPSIWNTQGLEKSHYMARTAYFRHTQHGGARFKANSLKELFQWFYRRILQRKYQTEVLLHSKTAQALRRQQKDKRRLAFMNSTALDKQKEWRDSMTFVNHKWMKTM